MKEKIDKFAQLEKSMSEDRGPFWLFALFLREDAPDTWDLLIAAPWTQGKVKEALQYTVEKLKQAFEPSPLTELSRIVVVDKDNPFLEAMNRAMRVEHSVAEVRDSNFFGLQIKHAFIISSLSPSLENPVPAA